MRSHSGSSSWGGRRYPPRVFTEQGVATLSSVLHSERAVHVNTEIMRTFVRLRLLRRRAKDARGGDPPWKRERKARGPPLELEGVFSSSFSPSSPVPDEFSQLWPSAEEWSREPAETEDEFNQLPPRSDDEI